MSCPYCNSPDGPRSRFLFRADVRVATDNGSSEDRTIPVRFCPACGKNLDAKSSAPKKATDKIPNGFQLITYAVCTVVPQFENMTPPYPEPRLVTKDFAEARKESKRFPKMTKLVRYLYDIETGECVSQCYEYEEKDWSDTDEDVPPKGSV